MVNFEDVTALCKEAGDAALGLQAHAHRERKTDGSPVTDGDLVSDRILSDGLARYGIGILSEESSSEASSDNRDRLWVVDPLDGTSSYVAGGEGWAVSVALLEHGAPIFGVVYAPALKTLWSAARGAGAYREASAGRQRISVSEACDPRGATILLSEHHLSKEAEAVAGMLGAKPILSPGLALKTCRIAEGAADLYWTEGHVGEWDVCAVHIILEEAGGKMTDATGRAFAYGVDPLSRVPGVAASNGFLHGALTQAGRSALQHR